VRALDVGCGLGLIHRHLGALDGRLDGIDISHDVVEEASHRNPSVRYRTYDGTTMPYADGELALVFAICVLHHVNAAAWPAFVGEMVRVTRPGGMIALIEHNPLNPLTRLVVARCAFDDDVVLVRKRRLERLLASLGTGQIESRYILFSPWQRLRRLDRHLGRVPLGAQYVTYANRG
jgi:SAM-dependent methyltransferase